MKRKLPPLPAEAKPAIFPEALTPQLATLTEKPPDGEDWLYEVKFDGYRMLARLDEKEARLFTRNGHDWTAKLATLARELRKLKLPSCWLDGEIVMPGREGLPDFDALQHFLEHGGEAKLRYYVFDLPYYNGFDLRGVPLEKRRQLLSALLGVSAAGTILFSESFSDDGKTVLESACRLGLEGVIGKRKSSRYVSGRSQNWLKLKCSKRQEFVIVGYTASSSPSRPMGALLLGVYDGDGKLQYAGKVGTGFSADTLRLLAAKFRPLIATHSPLADKPPEAKGHWLEPSLAAEVSFSGWTTEGRVRHAVFRGLREDKPARLITREINVEKEPLLKRNKAVSPLRQAQDATILSGVKLSNPRRIVDPEAGWTKADIAGYYRLAAPYMLPYLTGRPVAFLRAPSGLTGRAFVQKHADTMRIPGLKFIHPAEEEKALPEIASPEALLGAVQMNVIEFHVWNMSGASWGRPDQIVFDLDPGEGLDWPLLVEAAMLTRRLLESLDLKSFVKTSGGKGLHLFVPILPQQDWEEVKAFAKRVAEHLAAVMPTRFVSLSGPRNRIGKVFVDYLRNGYGATTAAAFTVRARPGMGVSVPCGWEELAGLSGGDHWTLANVAERFALRHNPWDDYEETRQSLTPAIKLLPVQ